MTKHPNDRIYQYAKPTYSANNEILGLTKERKEIATQNQIDSLKNENLFLSQQLLKLEEELYGYKVRNQKQLA
jgi:hypothetical protein